MITIIIIVKYLKPTCRIWWWPFRYRACGTFPRDPCLRAWPWGRRRRHRLRAEPRTGVARRPGAGGGRRARRPRPARAFLRPGNRPRRRDGAARGASWAWVSWCRDSRRLPWRRRLPRPRTNRSVEAAAVAARGTVVALVATTASCCYCCCWSTTSWRKSRWTTRGPCKTTETYPANVGHRRSLWRPRSAGCPAPHGVTGTWGPLARTA